MRDDSGRNRSTLCYLMVYAVLVGLAIIVNLPGRASSDAIDSLYQARHLEALTSWHAPFVTFCYWLLAPVVGTPTSALVIQSLLLMLWPAAIATRIIQARCDEALKAGACLVWFIVCMTLIGAVGYIVKDFLLVGFMSAALAAFIGHREAREAKSCLALRGLWIFFCILACCLVRPPNIVVFACAAILAALVSFKQNGIGKRLGFAGGIIASVWVTALMVNSWLLPAPSTKPEKATFLFDIVGVSYYADENLLEALERNATPERTIKDCYRPMRVDHLIWGECKDYTQIYWETLTPKIWRNAIKNRPLAYVKHRIAFMWYLLDNENIEWIAPPPPYVLVQNTSFRIDLEKPEKRVGLQFWAPTISYLPFARVARYFFTGPLGRPLVWIGLLALALINLRKLPPSAERTMIAILIAVGLSNVLMLGIFSPGDDLRYLLPTAFCALVVSVKLVELGARRWVPRREPRA